MAKIIDISSKITNEPKYLMIAEDFQVKVDDRKNTVLKAMQLMENGANDVKEMDKLLELVLGKEATKKINEMDLSFEGYVTIVKAVMSIISNIPLEEFDKRFQNQK
jgi:hypothetical protein